MTNIEQDSPPPAINGRAIGMNKSWKPVVTYSLMAITIAVYGLQLATQYLLGTDLPAALGMKVNELIIQGQIWRLFTPMFLHASVLHIGFNMYALFVIGTGLERFYGRGRYLTLYLLSGFTGNVASFLFSVEPSLGASTAMRCRPYGVISCPSLKPSWSSTRTTPLSPGSAQRPFLRCWAILCTVTRPGHPG